MTIGKMIAKLRAQSNFTQEQFAALLGVSQQSVGKWENGTTMPEIEKLVTISRHFGISLDALIMGNDSRFVEEMEKKNPILKPEYSTMHFWEFYAGDLPIEYRQSIEEGLDVEAYKDIFAAVSRLPQDEYKKKLGDVLFEIVSRAPQKKNYPYSEPSDLESIKTLRKPYPLPLTVDRAKLESKVRGAWVGRVCGCQVGKDTEGIRSEELIPFLKDTGNYPMYRYVLHSDLTDETNAKYKFPFAGGQHADHLDRFLPDDDINYVVLAQTLIEEYGFDFTSENVAQTWIAKQSKNAYCTAERVAFCNFVKGFVPPKSAVYQNPYREWIGAQIRGDYFGYINPGNPERAAEMAYRDASISHIKNGIYGEMFVAAMLAIAATTDNIEDIILGGLAQIPATSRFYEAMMEVYNGYKNGVTKRECIEKIHARFDEHDSHDWCHVISNAMIVVACLLYGEGDYTKSICLAVMCCFDTDCNGATVGSVLGMANGFATVDPVWYAPFNNIIGTAIFGKESITFDEAVAKTMEHIEKNTAK